MATPQQLFGPNVPPWKEDSPQRLFTLLPGYQAGTLTDAELREYTHLLMGCINNSFHTHRYVLTLPQVGLEPQDVAQDTLIHLLRQTRTLRLEHPCWRVFLKLLLVSCYRYVSTQANRAAARQRRTDRSFTDGHLVERAAPPPPGREREREAELCRGLLDAEDEVIGDIPIRGPALTLEHVVDLFRRMAGSVVTGHGIPALHELPPGQLRSLGEYAPSLHALIGCRLYRWACKHAAA